MPEHGAAAGGGAVQRAATAGALGAAEPAGRAVRPDHHVARDRADARVSPQSRCAASLAKTGALKYYYFVRLSAYFLKRMFYFINI